MLKLEKIIEIVMQVVDDVQRVKGSAELQQILKHGKDAADEIVDTTVNVADDVQEMMKLALELYDSLNRKSRALTPNDIKPLSAMQSREDILNYAKACAQALEE